jgi:hypothetical protein
MNFSRIEYIKNVNPDDVWAYHIYPEKSYFQLNFKEGEGVDNHALNLPRGSLIILSQRPPNEQERYLTHVVELVNEGQEDKPQWMRGTWGIFRWVKVHWVAADFNNHSLIPIDRKVMRADWGWQDTKAKRLDSPNLMSEWGTIERLRESLKEVFH